MGSLLQYVRVGARSLRRSPGFSLTAILTLALGIGLATAVFAVADALLLRRLPVVDQGRLVVLAGESPDGRISDWPLALDDAREFTRGSRALARVAFVAREGATPLAVRDGDRISRLNRALVSGDFFTVLGARPVLGRALQPEDDAPGAAPVLVLSHRAWQDRYGGAADVLGRRVVLHQDGRTYTIVGVMPPGLGYPRGVDAWGPVLADRREGGVPLLIVGRLTSSGTAAAARAELTAFYRRDGAPAFQRDLRGVARPLPALVLGDTRPAVLAFAAASALLLLITCVNVATLLLVRGLARVREVAVRTALGAARRSVIAQLLTENALLALVGGAFGAAVAAVAVRGFVAAAPAGTPRLDEIHVNATVLAGAVGITAVAMLLFGLAPAVLASRGDAREVLRSGMRQSASSRSRRAAEGLVAAQVALATLVLSAAALVGGSLRNLEHVELAFTPSHLLVVELALRSDEYDSAPKQIALLERLVPALQATPGVRAVSPVVAVPFSGAQGWDSRPAREGQPAEEAAANPVLNMELVSPSYFTTFELPVLRGRAFTDADRNGAPRVVILSESAARYYWPGRDPVGERVTMGRSAASTLTVVGVVPDTRYRDLREARPTIYFPLAQSFFPFAPTTLAIRTSRPPSQVVPALRRVLAETAPGVALASAAPFDTFLDGPLAQPRLNAMLLGVFAGAAVVLAAVGLFAVMATMVRQRTRELGIRMALGATAGEIGRLVLRRGMALAAAGMTLGLLCAVAANRALAGLLFGISPTDAPTLAGVALGLLVVAALASFVPARTSSRIEPAVTLRAE